VLSQLASCKMIVLLLSAILRTTMLGAVCMMCDCYRYIAGRNTSRLVISSLVVLLVVQQQRSTTSSANHTHDSSSTNITGTSST
jgi:hypothetical protein